jgi:hypothetical protein
VQAESRAELAPAMPRRSLHSPDRASTAFPGEIHGKPDGLSITFLNFYLLTTKKLKRIMNKKDYLKPTMKVVQLQHRSQILAGSYTMTTTGGRNQLSNGTDDLGWNEE